LQYRLFFQKKPRLVLH